MNLYMIVEGKRTETTVYPAWLSILAEYHYYYLRKMFAERNMIYRKTKTEEVQKEEYLDKLISRYKTTGHISTFGQWYNFIVNNFR